MKGIIKGHPSINNVKKASFSRSFPNGKGKRKNKKVLSNPNKVLNPFRDIGKREKINDVKPKEICFHCGVEGHWKMNYPNYLAQKMDSGVIKSLVIVISFVAGTSNS